MTGKSSKKSSSAPWWQHLNLPAFPPAPWELARFDEGGATSWLITTEGRTFNLPPVAIVPTSSEHPEIDDEQRAAAYLISAAPALFMAGAALLRALENSNSTDPMQRRALDLLRHALDLARGRG